MCWRARLRGLRVSHSDDADKATRVRTADTTLVETLFSLSRPLSLSESVPLLDAGEDFSIIVCRRVHTRGLQVQVVGSSAF